MRRNGRFSPASSPRVEDPRPAFAPRACPVGRAPSKGSARLRFSPQLGGCRERAAAPRTEETPAGGPCGATPTQRTFIFSPWRPCSGRVPREPGTAGHIPGGWSPTARAPSLHGFSGVLRGKEGRTPLGRRTTHSPRTSRGDHSSRCPDFSF